METQFKARVQELAPLSKEHKEGLLFVDQVRKGIASVAIERVRNYVRWYWQNHIRPHFYHEEKILLPYLSPRHPFLLRVKEDHSYIRDLVLELDNGGDASMFRTLCDLLVAHIRFEEQQLFALLQDELKPDQLDSINKALHARPVEEEQWNDPFWK